MGTDHEALWFDGPVTGDDKPMTPERIREIRETFNRQSVDRPTVRIVTVDEFRKIYALDSRFDWTKQLTGQHSHHGCPCPCHHAKAATRMEFGDICFCGYDGRDEPRKRG